MSRTVSEEELSLSVIDFMGSLRNANEPVVLDSDGDTVAVAMSRDEFDRIGRMRERAWNAVDELHKMNADLDPDEVYTLVTDVVEEVRQERYEQRLADEQRHS